MPVSADDAALVLAVRGGDRGAFDALYRRWADRCFDVARRIVHDDGRAAEVTQEVFLVAWTQLDQLQDPAAFGGWVLRASRNKALNRLEREQRSTTIAGDAPLFVDRAGDGPGPDQVLEQAVTTLDHQELVAAATAVLGEREASVLDLHLRHGLSAAEIGDELGVTTNNAHQLLFRTKKKLTAGIRAYVLVRRGRPSCDDLALALDTAGVTSFGRPAQDVIDRHVADCDDCTGRQAALLDPAGLFAAVPVLVMTPAARGSIEAGLRAAGVPIGEGAPTPDGPRDDQSADTDDRSEPDAGDAGDGAATEEASGPDGGAAPGPLRSRRRAMILIAAVLAVLAVVVGSSVGSSDGDTEDLATVGTTDARRGPTSTSLPASSTVAASTPTTTGTTTVGSTFSRTRPAPGPTAPPAPTSAPPLPAPPAATVPGLVDPGRAPTTVAPRPPTTTTTAPPAPTIDSLTVQPLGEGGSCPAAQWGTRLTWTTTHATTVAISATTVVTVSGLAPDGNRVICRPTPGNPPGGWKLKATGPGGTDTATA